MKKIVYTLILNLFVLNLFSQHLTVKGKVTDSSVGTSLPGVNIVVKGTIKGAVTDINGEYTHPALPL
jgi:hypothetical protein